MKRFILVLFTAMFMPQALAEINVAVAANFTSTFNKLAEVYQADTRVKVQPSFASTGKLYAQVRNGAPFQLFLSADVETAQRLEQEGETVAGTRQIYAIGRLVLWSGKPGLVDARGEVLRKGGFNRLAIANPKTAPYGLAAQQVMSQLGVAESLKDKLVTGESVAQAYQYVSSGNAELGFVALSQVQGAAERYWLVPEKLHDPLEQQMVILKRGQGDAAVRKFYDYIRSEKAQKIIASFGYGLPGGK